jgi:hypothetical protein
LFDGIAQNLMVARGNNSSVFVASQIYFGAVGFTEDHRQRMSHCFLNR